jgi:hypothetical protein
MKVTDFYPVFYAEDIEAETKRFTEDLGFEVKHKPQIEFLIMWFWRTKRKDALILYVPTFRQILSKKDIWECVQM